MAIILSRWNSKRAEDPVLPQVPHHRMVAPAIGAPTSARRFRGAFSPRETRHNFIVEILPRPAWNKPRPYLYTCARCKWSFRVNDSAGSIIALNERGEPLQEPLRSHRAASFAEGPCGAFPVYALERLTQPNSCGWFRRMLVALLSRYRAPVDPAIDLKASPSDFA